MGNTTSVSAIEKLHTFMMPAKEDATFGPPIGCFCKTVYLKLFILPSFSVASPIRHVITSKANIQKNKHTKKNMC